MAGEELLALVVSGLLLHRVYLLVLLAEARVELLASNLLGFHELLLTTPRVVLQVLQLLNIVQMLQTVWNIRMLARIREL